MQTYNPNELTKEELLNKNWCPWDEKLILCPKSEFPNIKLGSKLKAIDDEIVRVGTDYIDQDTRFGILAYGVEK